MKGFLKMKAVDFDTWNNSATVKANGPGYNLNCDSYTYCIPDKDKAYVWARIEHDFVTEPLISYEKAIIQGMIENEGQA